MPRLRPAWSWSANTEAMTLPPTDPLLHSIGLEEAFRGSTGRGVKVGIIDSGIDNGHVAVSGVVRGWSEPVSDSDDVISYNMDPHEDLFGHGTACAGIIHGIAPGAELYSVRVLGRRLSGKGSIFAAGLRWALDNDMNVVNLSLGTPNREHFSQFHELVDEAYYRGVILVTAANNLPVVSFPSLYSAVISVACYDGASGQDPLEFYRNPSPPVEFGAKGIDIKVAWLEGGYMTVTGNSFAAPHMTGIVAMLLEKHPNLTPFQVKTVLGALARNAYRLP